MNKLKSTAKINALFLTTVLIAGTITAVYPSFVIGAQAQEYYGMERDYKKSEKKDVSVKNVKCNNINVNVNGLELNLTSVPFLSGLLASEAHEGERGASSYGSGSGSYGDKSRSDGDFKFICINNNNNTVTGNNDGETLIPLTCEECFEKFLTAEELQTFIEGAGGTLGSACDTLEDGVVLEIDLRLALSLLGVSENRINDIIECLLEAGIVFAPEPSGFNTQGGGGSLASFGIHDGGTEEDLSALEKIEN